MKGAAPVLFNIAAAAMPILTLPIIARLFPPVLYGSYAAFLAAATLACFLGTFRLDLAFIAERESRYGRALAAAAAVTIVLAAILWAVILPIFLQSSPIVPQAFGIAPIVAGPFVVMLGAMVLAQATLLRSGATSALATFNLTFHLVFFGTTVTLSWLGLQLSGNGILDGRIAAIFAALAIFLIFARRLGLRPAAPALRDIPPALRRHINTIRFTYPYTIVGMLSADLILFTLLLRGDAAVAGGYGLARTVLLAPGSVFSAAVSPLYFRFALVTDATTVAERTRRLALATGPASFFAFGVAAGAARPLADLFFGAKWAIVTDIILLFSFPIAWTILTGWPERIFEAQGRQANAFLLHLFWGAAATAAIAVAILAGGDSWTLMVGYAVATLIFQMVYAVQAFALAGVSARWIAAICSLATAAFGLGFALTVIVEHILLPPTQVIAAFVLVAIAAAVAARWLLSELSALNAGATTQDIRTRDYAKTRSEPTDSISRDAFTG